MTRAFVRTGIAIAIEFFITAAVPAVASAQTTTGTISGHVVDSQGLALPGVTVSAASPNLQGVRTVVTSTNGDYIFSALPSGTYTLTFELSGFQNQQRTMAVAPTQVIAEEAGAALIGHKLDNETLSKLDAAAGRACKPINDKRGTIAYRIKVAGVLLKRTAAIAAQRAQEN